MKKLTLQIFFLMMAVVFMSSCGTISGLVTKGKRPVFLMMAPSDIRVTVNGESQDITKDAFATTESATYYVSSVRLPYKENLTMVISSGGKSASIDLKSKTFGAVFVGNFFSFPIVGHILDGVTKNSKTLKPRYIDCERALEGKPMSEWRSQGKLKRMGKRAAK